MKKIIGILVLASVALSLNAQRYFTRDGKVQFSSEAPLEKIEAVNNKASSVFDLATGDVEFAVLIRSFHFDKALMEEHFNENYLESTKYPKATFKGKVTNLGELNLSQSGKYAAHVKGDLTMHGVTRPIEVTGTLVTGSDVIHATATFEIAVADYNIEIPKVVRDNIAKTVQILVDIDYKPLAQ